MMEATDTTRMTDTAETAERKSSAARAADNARFYGSLGREGLDERIGALEDEWDMERAAEVLLAGAGVFGLVMGLVGSRFWRLLVWASLPMLFLLGQGRWKPLEDLLKSAGLRSRKEIREEMFALRALRGEPGV
jgi:hypothetical protein